MQSSFAGLAAALVLSLMAAGAQAQAPAAPFGGTATPEQQARCARLPAGAARACVQAYSGEALQWPKEPLPPGAPVKLEMALHRPAGAGPFPLLMLLHTCAPLAQNPQVKLYAEAALQAGYAVFVLDSFTQRGLGDTCYGSVPGPIPVLRARDASEALAWLQQFEWIDKQRIAAMGFSQGARTLYWLANERNVRFFSQRDLRFAALVGMYGECYSRQAGLDYVRDESSVPMLALLGERDEDGDPRECVPRLERAKAAGAPFEWHVYPGAVHSWDNENMQPWKRSFYAGSPSRQVVQGYDAAVTADARKRAFDFLARTLQLK